MAAHQDLPPAGEGAGTAMDQSLWQTALKGSGTGVWEWDLQTNRVSNWVALPGQSNAGVTVDYAVFLSMLHLDDLDLHHRTMAQHLEGLTRTYHADLRLRYGGSDWTWVHSRGKIVQRDAQGKPLRMIGTYINIHARKLAEEALEQKSKLLRDTLDNISQGISVYDSHNKLIAFNSRTCELLDLPESFLASQPTELEVSAFQRQRGDFGAQAEWVQEGARGFVLATDDMLAPERYLRTTPTGKTLEIKSRPLSTGGLVRTFTDVSDYVQAEAARERLDKLLAAMQGLAQVGGWEVDFVTDQVIWTEGVYRIFETSPEQFQPSTALATAQRFFSPQAMETIRASYYDKSDQQESHSYELEATTFTGRKIWLQAVGQSRWRNGEQISRVSVIQNITERKMARAALLETENRWKLALESTGDGVWDWHFPSGVVFHSKRLVEMFGYAQGEIRNDTTQLDVKTHPDDFAQLVQDRQAHLQGRTPTYVNEHRVRCKDGSWKWVLSRGTVVSRDANGQPLRMIGTHTDITERKNAEALIRQQAFFDALTGLPNRRMFRDRLEQEIKKCKRDGYQLGVLFIDIDQFKEVNDTLGHDSGDLLLIEASNRLKRCVREVDTVARMGGDEFTIILTELAFSDRLQPILAKLLHAMEAVFQLGSEQVFVSASIGVTIYPQDGTDIDALFKNADQALYVAKAEGRNRFSFFTPALQEAAQKRARLAHDLRNALAEGQFFLVYQPIIDLRDDSIYKAEALIRWEHPTRGLVSPATFIPIAESSGIIVGIGEWVFQQAAQQVNLWRKTLHPDFQISVNRSPLQFHRPDDAFAPWGTQLQALGLPGDAVVVEITEGLLLDTTDVVAAHLLGMRDAGIQVSLDDFGTGYSSLAYLQKFDIDFLKIDQSFVRNLQADSTDHALCKAIIAMAHTLGMKVIAEGVETQSQRDLLKAAGCDYAQGYFYAKPLVVEAFEALCAGRTSGAPAGGNSA